jgi:hypothetical protein
MDFQGVQSDRVVEPMPFERAERNVKDWAGLSTFPNL